MSFIFDAILRNFKHNATPKVVVAGLLDAVAQLGPIQWEIVHT